MSNGEYKSIEHRAVVNPEKERLSIAAFHSPNYRTMIGPLPDLLKENSANYKTISFEDFVRIVVTRKLDGKSLLGHMKFADWFMFSNKNFSWIMNVLIQVQFPEPAAE